MGQPSRLPQCLKCRCQSHLRSYIASTAPGQQEEGFCPSVLGSGARLCMLWGHCDREGGVKCGEKDGDGSGCGMKCKEKDGNW